jgi:hypothetical protein
MASFIAQALRRVVRETESDFQPNPLFISLSESFTSPNKCVSVCLELSNSALPIPVCFASNELRFSLTLLPIAEIAPMPVIAISITYSSINRLNIQRLFHPFQRQ